jgi:hypothetical protein
MARKQAGRSGRTRTQGRGSRPRGRAKAPAARKAAKPARRAAPAGKKNANKKTRKKAAPAGKTNARGARKTPGARKTAPKTRPAAKKKAAARPARPQSPQQTAAARRQAPSLERSRRRLTEFEDNIPTPPSSLDLDRTPTAARSGRQTIIAARSHHTETGPELTGGDVDADWEDAYAVGDEAPGGDNPTPDQDRVDDIGRALGVEYQDNEELKGADKIAGRDKHRWELDPASAEDYNDREET